MRFAVIAASALALAAPAAARPPETAQQFLREMSAPVHATAAQRAATWSALQLLALALKR